KGLENLLVAEFAARDMGLVIRSVHLFGVQQHLGAAEVVGDPLKLVEGRRMRHNVDRFELDAVLRKPRFRFFTGTSAMFMKKSPTTHDPDSFRLSDKPCGHRRWS